MNTLENKRKGMCLVLAFGLISCGAWVFAHDDGETDAGSLSKQPVNSAAHNAAQLANQGEQTFRFDTFGDESFWGGALQLHQAIEGAAWGGVGSGISPKAALALGLKVDVKALPDRLVQQLLHGKVDLDDPAVTLQLIKLNSVLGVKGSFNTDGSLQSAPKPTPGVDFDPAAAKRGDALFSGKANCNSCHREPIWTEPGWNDHSPGEMKIDSFQADRSPDGNYKTMNLAGLFIRERGLFMQPQNKGRFYHDGRFQTLMDVVNSYNTRFSLGLNDQEKADLVEYLKSL